MIDNEKTNIQCYDLFSLHHKFLKITDVKPPNVVDGDDVETEPAENLVAKTTLLHLMSNLNPYSIMSVTTL